MIGTFYCKISVVEKEQKPLSESLCILLFYILSCCNRVVSLWFTEWEMIEKIKTDLDRF